MYAIVEIAGHQFKVQKDQQVYVNRLDVEEGKKVTFDRVLLVRRQRQGNRWRPSDKRRASVSSG